MISIAIWRSKDACKMSISPQLSWMFRVLTSKDWMWSFLYMPVENFERRYLPAEDFVIALRRNGDAIPSK